MSTNIEIEAKALVSEEEYKKFIDYFRIRKNEYYTQENFYIDTIDLSLLNYGVSLRVREKNNKFELTLKTPLSEGLLEKNQDLSFKEFLNLKEKNIFPDGDIKRFLTMLDFDISKFKIVSSLKTIRVDIDYNDGLLSLDKNEYNNKIDYEIEFEFNSKVGAISNLENLFNQLGIKFVENKVSKVRRAYSSIRK